MLIRPFSVSTLSLTCLLLLGAFCRRRLIKNRATANPLQKERGKKAVHPRKVCLLTKLLIIKTQIPKMIIFIDIDNKKYVMNSDDDDDELVVVSLPN